MPVSQQWNDPSLFQQDPAVYGAGRTAPKVYVAVVAAGLKIWRDPGMVLLVFSTLLLMLYSAGVYWLSWTVLGHELGALIIGIVSLRTGPNIATTIDPFGIVIGNAPPRSFVFAAAPWLIAFFISNANSLRAALGLGFVMGLLGSIHPVTSLHIYLMISTALALGPWPQTRFKRLAAMSAGFGVGILPYAFQWLRNRDSSALSIEVVQFRLGAELSSLSWCLKNGFLSPVWIVPLGLAAAGWFLMKSDDDREKAQWIMRLAIAAGAWTLMGPLECRLLPGFHQVLLMRMQAWWFLFFLIMSGFLVRRLFTDSSNYKKLAGWILSVCLFITAAGGRFGELMSRENWRHRSVLLADAGHSFGLPEKGSFLDLCVWAKKSTGRQDVFLFPPQIAAASFRVYAERPLFMTWKDGSVITASGALANEWYERYRSAQRLYGAFERDEVSKFALAHGIGFVVQEASHPAIALPVAYQNEGYRVYRMTLFRESRRAYIKNYLNRA